MPELKEKSLEELYKMSYKELSKYLKISEKDAVRLKLALNPKYYPVLTNNALTYNEMAKKLGITESTVKAYRASLTKAGLIERKRKKRDTKERIRKLLDKNPLTWREIREKMGNNFYAWALVSRDIVSIGHRGRKLYCLKGQEDLARSRLKMLEEFEKIEERLNKRYAKLLDAITQPMTYKDLVERSGWSMGKVQCAVRNLEKEGKLVRFTLYGGIGKYRRYKIFGKLAKKQLYFYKPGQEEDVAKFIIENLPPKEKLDKNIRKCLTHVLKQNLPEQVFNLVYQYYSPPSTYQRSLANYEVS
jgi:predicted transcriptional regulator